MGKIKIRNYITEKTSITLAEADLIVDVLIQAMSETLLTTGKLSLPNFGSFKIKTAKGRLARNPKTGDPVQVPDRSVIKFKTAGKMKEKILKIENHA